MRRENSAWWSAGFTAEWWDAQDDEARAAFLAQLSPRQIEEFERDWNVWARDSQFLPDGEWDTVLMLMGRGTGKTRAAVEYLNDSVKKDGELRVAIVGPDEKAIRRTMIEGVSGFLKTAPSWFRPEWYPSNGVLEWPNGALGFVYSAEDTEGLRGPEFHLGWFDEPMAVPAKKREEAMNNLELCLRLPPHPRLLITTTPKPHRWIREQKAMADAEEKREPDEAKRNYLLRIGHTSENRANLAKSFYNKMMRRFDGTNVGRQELYAEILGDEAGALWTADRLDNMRVRPPVEWAPDKRAAYNEAAKAFSRHFDRKVIGVDPNAKTASNHAAGIVPVGLRSDGMRFCLGDWSQTNKSPAEWAKDVVRCYYHFDADEVAAEVNNGGEMVRDIVYQAAQELKLDPPIVRMVRAKKDKIIRATPVSTLYELKKAAHFGTVGIKDRPGPLFMLEEQMCALHDELDPTGEDFDRADALVWGMKSLGLGEYDDDGGDAGMMSFDQLAGAA